MSNPLDDPRAKDLMAAVPDDVRLLWQSYKQAAGEAQWTARGLRATQADHAWKGRAADQFRSSIGHFPRQLDSVCNGYWEVANALQVYEGQLRDLQSRYRTASHHYGEAHFRFTVAQGQVGGDNLTYRADLDPRNHASAAKRADDYRTLIGDSRTFDTIRSDLAQHATAVTHVLHDFESDRETCRLAVKAAIGYAIRPAKPLGPAVGLPSRPNGPGHGRNGSTGPVHRPGHSSVGVSGPSVDGNAPASARAKIAAMTRTADSLLGTPYVYGGGHGGAWGKSGGGLDCSSFVSNVLHAGGYLSAPQTTDSLVGQHGIANGPGRWVTIYDRPFAGDNSHVIIEVNGQFYEEGGGEDGVPDDVHKLNPSQAYLDSFTRRMHPAGL